MQFGTQMGFAIVYNNNNNNNNNTVLVTGRRVYIVQQDGAVSPLLHHVLVGTAPSIGRWWWAIFDWDMTLLYLYALTPGDIRPSLRRIKDTTTLPRVKGQTISSSLQSRCDDSCMCSVCSRAVALRLQHRGTSATASRYDNARNGLLDVGLRVGLNHSATIYSWVSVELIDTAAEQHNNSVMRSWASCDAYNQAYMTSRDI